MSGYFRVKSCVIDANTFADNPGPLFALDASYGQRGCTLLPHDVTISNNLMAAPSGAVPMIVAAKAPTGIVWRGNLAVGGELGIDKPRGVECAVTVPPDWRSRPKPDPLERTDVGPGWMRRAGARDGHRLPAPRPPPRTPVQ
ncbi:MAG: hypothetical protein ACYTKD_11060 [Planctomycetota bacterium]